MLTKLKNIKYKNEIILFLLLLTLTMPVFNAVNSITMALGIFVLILERKKLNFKILPKSLIIVMFFFVAALVFSSLAINDMDSVSKAFKYLYWMLPFFVVFYNMQLCKNDRVVLYSLAISLFVSAAAVIYQYHFEGEIRPGGFYHQPNRFAFMIDILLPFTTMIVLKNVCANKNKFIEKFLFLPLIAGAYALFLSGSRGGMIGVIIGLLLCLTCYCLRKLKISYFILALASMVVLFSGIMFAVYDSAPDLLQRRYDNERLLALESSYNMWNDNKVFGIGLNNWEKEYADNYKLSNAKENLIHSHNILAFFFSTTGLVGGIAYCVFIVGIFIFLIKKLHETEKKETLFVILAMLWAFFAINIHGMVDSGLNNKYVMRLFYCCFALTLFYLSLEERKGDSTSARIE